MKIEKTTIIGDILNMREDAEEILTSFGLHCLSCPCAQAETLEEACQVHGIDIDSILNKLNK